MKRVFRFILIMVMAIAYTMTADAKDVYFATHRTVTNEYGEVLPLNFSDAYCPTRIEVDYDAKTLLIKTKTHGTANYTYSEFTIKDKFICFFDVNEKMIGAILFLDNDLNEFVSLTICKKNDTHITYFEKENFKKNILNKDNY